MDTKNKMPFNKDEVRGKVDQVAGNIKEKVGRAVGDVDMEQKGASQRAAGDVEQGLGKARRKVGEVIKDIGDKLGR
ncbi:MAG: CsbD family protein [Acidobacteriota bacterium]